MIFAEIKLPEKCKHTSYWTEYTPGPQNAA